jgi:hypothetical protein
MPLDEGSETRPLFTFNGGFSWYGGGFRPLRVISGMVGKVLGGDVFHTSIRCEETLFSGPFPFVHPHWLGSCQLEWKLFSAPGTYTPGHSALRAS